MSTTPHLLVVDNAEASRYELRGSDAAASRDAARVISSADYVRSGGVVTVSHVETDPQQQGHGYAAMLMSGIVDDLRSRNLTIVPRCSYAASYLRDHPETHDLLTSS